MGACRVIYTSCTTHSAALADAMKLAGEVQEAYSKASRVAESGAEEHEAAIVAQERLHKA